MTRIVLADDSVLLRVGLERLLDDEGFSVVGSVGDADALHRAVEAENPDMAIVDIRMPPGFTDEGLRAALTLRRERPDVAVLLLSQYIETRDVLTVLEERGDSGVGYLLKDRITDIEHLLEGVRRVAAGGTAIDPLVVERVIRRPRRDQGGVNALSAREREILALMATGCSNAGIAQQLFVAERTVEAHIRNIFTKLGVPDQPAVNRRVLAVLSVLRA